jgi:nicotinamidase-related amidase
MNTAVVWIDNQQGYSKIDQRIFLPQVTFDVTKIVPKIVAHNKKLRHTGTKLSHNYDESSYVLKGLLPRLTLLFAEVPPPGKSRWL